MSVSGNIDQYGRPTEQEYKHYSELNERLKLSYDENHWYSWKELFHDALPALPDKHLYYLRRIMYNALNRCPVLLPIGVKRNFIPGYWWEKHCVLKPTKYLAQDMFVFLVGNGVSVTPAMNYVNIFLSRKTDLDVMELTLKEVSEFMSLEPHKDLKPFKPFVPDYRQHGYTIHPVERVLEDRIRKRSHEISYYQSKQWHENSVRFYPPYRVFPLIAISAPIKWIRFIDRPRIPGTVEYPAPMEVPIYNKAEMVKPGQFQPYGSGFGRGRYAIPYEMTEDYRSFETDVEKGKLLRHQDLRNLRHAVHKESLGTLSPEKAREFARQLAEINRNSAMYFGSDGWDHNQYTWDDIAPRAKSNPLPIPSEQIVMPENWGSEPNWYQHPARANRLLYWTPAPGIFDISKFDSKITRQQEERRKRFREKFGK